MTTTYFFNDINAWESNEIPFPKTDFTFPENTIIKIKKNVLSEFGYNHVIIPKSSKVVFEDEDIHLISETINLFGEVHLNKRSSITCDTFNQSNLHVLPFHEPSSWDNGVVPGIGNDINIPKNTAILITSSTILESYYGTLNIPQGSQLAIDSSVIDSQLLVTSFNVSGTISSAQHNSVKIYRGTSDLFLPVYLDSDGTVLDSSENAVSSMDSSYNFVMHSSQTSADSFSKFIKLKLDNNNTPSFIFNQSYKTQFNNQLISDISGTKLIHFDEKFFTNQRNTNDDTLGNMLIQYISSIIFDDPRVTNAVSNSTDIINNVLNSNLHEQFTNIISLNLDETNFNTNSIINAMYKQLKSTHNSRFTEFVANTTYDFPVKSGDQIAIFVKMKANLVFSKSHSSGNSEQVYRILKSDNKLSTNSLIEFNDVDLTIKVLPTTWKIIINLS